MKKILYKSIISIVLVLFVLLMQPNKKVKALETQAYQAYPVILLEVPLYQAIYEQENVNTYEFLVQYVLENIFIETLNENEYFFITEHYLALRKGINRNANTYILEEIETGSYTTLFTVRFTLTKSFVNNEYFGPDYIFDFFFNNSAFYIYYDIYTDAYMEGYDVGYSEGIDRGYGDGYIDGHNDGYNSGYNDGLNDNNGFELGYNKGKSEGFQSGYDEGHWEGYNSGYNTGYYTGLGEGYNTGYDNGYLTGYDEGFLIGYDEGYIYGYNNGINEQLEDKDFTHLLKSVFIGVGSFLGINLLPGISIGALIAVPIVFGIISFIIGKRKD